MNIAHIAAISVAAVTIAVGADTDPQIPSPDQVAKILGIDAQRVSLTGDGQPIESLKGKVIWVASYQIRGDQNCAVSITLFPANRIKTDFIEKVGKNTTGFQKIERDDGDVIYHSLGGRDDEGTFFTTTLINHEGDWDMTLMLSRAPGVDESKLPIALEEDGIRLIDKFEALLRNKKAEQASGHEPPTRRESKAE